MKYRLSIAIVIVLSTLSFISCDRTIHEYPTPNKSLVILDLMQIGLLRLTTKRWFSMRNTTRK